ncbi:MAG TPA: 4'-phosphopantetheinyl transferase superfamily protein [Solirubrobacterales bacterium]|nr:4'-phosphopantetheinyl transferase superfamily protein [Solirubrobacterales bacterium]
MEVNWPPGPHRPSAPSEEVHVWRAELDRKGWPSLQSLPPTERKRAEGKLRPLCRERWVASRWALRQVLARYLDADPVAFELRLGKRGKPALADPTAALRFNLSHSGGLVLIAVAEGREVGIDIEQVDPRRDVVALANRGLDPAVRAAICEACPESRTRAFHDAWAHREALVKCLGSGLRAPSPPLATTLSALDAGPSFAAALAVAGPHSIPHRRFSLAPV